MGNCLNRVVLLGRLGADPTIRYTQSQDEVCSFTLATSESWKNSDGVPVEYTEWHRVVIFGRLAGVAGKYLRKGSQVYIEGASKTRKWQDQNGFDRYTTEVVVQGYHGIMRMLGGANGNSNSQHDTSNTNSQNDTSSNTKTPVYAPKPNTHTQAVAAHPVTDADIPPQYDDDIPF